jgi:hypothetical protein
MGWEKHNLQHIHARAEIGLDIPTAYGEDHFAGPPYSAGVAIPASAGMTRIE